MEEQGTIVVVLGYGCHLSCEMKMYLDLVVSFVAKNNVGAIIATGGYTNRKSAPGVSEAGMMATYLRERGVATRIILDETAVTTNQNLRSVVRVIGKRHFVGKRIVVFCDRARSIKVRILARIILGCWPELRPSTLTKGLRAIIMQLFVAMPLDVLASQFPFFEEMEIRRKERIMNQS